MSALPKVEVTESDGAGSTTHTVAGTSSEGGQTQYVLTSADGQEVIIDAQALEGGGLVQGATVQVVEGGQEVTYALQAEGDDQDAVVAALRARNAGETMEIIGSDGTTYTTNPDGTIQQKLFNTKEAVGEPAANIDQSFQYYDNIRGKINSEVLKDLVSKYDAENPSLSKNDRLHQWALVAREYCQVTGQTKSRTTLMKKMTSAKYYREGYEKGRDAARPNSGGFKSVKREQQQLPQTPEAMHEQPELPDGKRLKLYDQMRLEALRLERDAQKANLENAQIEGEKLSKESKILDVELEIMKMELAIRKEEALKAGVVFEMVDLDEDVDPGPDDEAAQDQPESKRLKTS